MLGAIAINGKRFHILEYLGALGLLLGLLAFTLTDMKVRRRCAAFQSVTLSARITC